MKHKLFFLIIILFLFTGSQTQACIGRILNIGIVDSANESLLAELVSVLINERTGTTVNIKVFNGFDEIYNALEKEEIGIVIENTDHAVRMLKIPKNEDENKDYDAAKKEFSDTLNLTMLKPFGFITGEKGRYYYSAVITEDVLVNFPALPRVINKLRDIAHDRHFDQVIESARSGEKIKRVARDFLKKKKLI